MKALENVFATANCKKNVYPEKKSSIFDSCKRNEFSIFCLWQFGEVELILASNEHDVDIKTKNSKSNSGSNETMQNDLALIFFWGENF